MKRISAILITLLLGYVGATGGAGLYAGWPEVFGIHFVTDEGWRMSVGMLLGEDGIKSPSVALSLDLVLAAGTAYVGSGELPDLDYYAGAGASASLLRPSPEINGHAMLGIEAFFVQMKSLGFFGELQLGQRFWFAPFGTSPYLGFRLGLTLH